MKKLLITCVSLCLIGIIVILVFYNKGYRVNVFNPSKLHCNQSFDPATWDSCNYTNFRLDTFNFPEIEYSQLPYIHGRKKPRVYDNYDAEGIPLHVDRRENNVNYHPVFLDLVGLMYMDYYVKTKNKEGLEKAYLIYNKMVNSSLKLDSSIYFPYTFPFPLHDCEEETMIPPWYSGMAQGQALSFFSRLYEETNDDKVLENCHKVFNSFLRLKGDGYDPWVTCVDKNGYLWLEEYPRDLPCFTLNGMIFAIYGLYDYYRITDSELALKYLNASLTTIKDNILRFRCEDDVSYYCLKHNNFNGRNPAYHKVHIRELKKLTELTGDPYFSEVAEIFIKDTEGKENLKVH